MNELTAAQTHILQSGNWYYYYFTPPALLVGRSEFERR
jgi:hypothetical protein